MIDTACFPALGPENVFSDLQTMNFFFSAWNENSTIIKEMHFIAHSIIITNQNSTLVIVEHFYFSPIFNDFFNSYVNILLLLLFL